MRIFTKRTCSIAFVCSLLIFSVLYVQNMQSRKNDGFAIEKIQSTLQNRPEWQLPPLPAECKSVFNQPYYYLGRGLQFYAFVSGDKKYVLKFMRHQRLKPHPIIEILGNMPLLRIIRDKQRSECAKRVNYMSDSLKVAMQYAKNESGLIFVHLNKGYNEFGNIQIFDKMGASYSVDLDKTEFVLQKRAELVKPTLTKLMQTGHVDEAKVRIHQIFCLLQDCAKNGVCDTDSQLIRKNNLGFLDDRAIYIDTGKLTLKESIKTKERFKKDLERLDPLYTWLQEMYPDLGECFITEKQQVLDGF